MQDAPPPGEDAPIASHPMVTRRKHQVKLNERQSSRPMITLPRTFEEFSPSSELSELESPSMQSESFSSELSEHESPSTQSEFSATSPMQDPPSPVEEALATIHPMVTRSKHQVQTTQRQSTRQKVPSCGDEASTASHLMATRGPLQIQVTQRKSSPSEQPTPRQRSVHPSPQVAPCQEGILTPPWLDTPKQGTSAQQQCNALQTSIHTPQQFYGPQQATSGQEQFYASQMGIAAQQQSLPNQERPVISDLSVIDPNLLSLIFKEAGASNPDLPLPPDPILLNIGKPIRIPIREFRDFRPFDTSHEEPSDLALSDNEGGTDVPPTSGSTPIENGEATKYSYKIRKPGEGRRNLREPCKVRDSTRSRKSTPKRTPVKACSQTKVRSPIRERTPINDREFNDEQTRFIILTRAYCGMPYDGITEALNAEFEGDDKDEPWTMNGIAKRLGAVKRDPKFDAYGKSWEDARVGIHEPEGLIKRHLWEAKGFLARLKKH
jgi:hypothetical protein